MERKKLYKAKKNWVIGLATGLAIMALGTNVAYADDNSSNEPITVSQQATTSTQQVTNQQGQVSVQPANTIGMSSNVAANPIGSFNKDNVGYINPNTEVDVYNNQPTHHLSHQSSYNYPEKLLNGFAQNDDLLKEYGTPNVYEYSNGSENPYKNVKPKQITTIPATDTDKVHYLNNGVANSIHFADPQGDPNYEEINKLSQVLAYADYKLLVDNYSQPRNDQNYGRFFGGDKPIVAPKQVLSTQDLNALYEVAYKNRPLITFDKNVGGHHITSFLQSSISFIDDGWGLTFDTGWRGYTFMDGKQIAFTGILHENDKNFSWKNDVLNYFAQSLAYKKGVAKEVDQNTPYMLVGRNYLPVTDILTSRELNRLENPFNISPTEIIFANDGVYAIINGAMGGYNPVMVQVPMAFLKQAYQGFYGENVKPDTTKPSKPNNSTVQKNFDERDNVFDQRKEDIGTIGEAVKESVIESSTDLGLDLAERAILISAITKDAAKFVLHIRYDEWFNKDDKYSLYSSVLKDFINAGADISYDTNNLTKDVASAVKDVVSPVIGAATAFKDGFQNTPLSSSSAKNKSAKERNGIYTDRRKRHIEYFKAKKDMLAGVIKKGPVAGKEIASNTTKKALVTAVVGVVTAVLTVLSAIYYYDKYFAVDEANKLRIKLIDRWSKR